MKKDVKFKIKKHGVVIFDYENVVHIRGCKYSLDAVYLIHLLLRANIPVIIKTKSEPALINAWWNKRGFPMESCIVSPNVKKWNNSTIVGITNRELDNQIIIDSKMSRHLPKYIEYVLGKFFKEDLNI